MNKYFSKAIFYSEKKNRINSMLAYMVCYAIALIHFLGNFYAMKKNSLFSGFDRYLTPSYSIDNTFLYFFFLGICITSVMYSYIEKDKKYYFMLTQPYTRDSMIITKTVSYAVSYIVPTIIYGLVSFVILIINKNYIGSYFNQISIDLFLKLFAILAILTFISAIIQLMQMLFGKMIAGVIFPFIYYFMIFFCLNIMSNFISKKIGSLRNGVDYLNTFLFSTGKITVNTEHFKSLPYLILRYMEKSYFLISLVLILASLIILLTIIKLNRKVKAENTSDIFLFKFSEIIFKAIFSIVFTVVISLFISGVLYYLYSSILGMNYSTYLMNNYGIAGKENIEHNLYLVLNILWIPLCVVIYKVFSRIMNKRRAI